MAWVSKANWFKQPKQRAKLEFVQQVEQILPKNKRFQSDFIVSWRVRMIALKLRKEKH